MENFVQELELLYKLQLYDIKINNIKNKINQAPLLIKEKQKSLDDKKSELKTEKKSLSELGFLKKEKEDLLIAKEKAIIKHLVELNSVKSNEIYKALLKKIEIAKVDKSILENDILEVMEEIDKKSVKIKEVDKELREFENKIRADINRIETFVRKFKEELLEMEKITNGYKLEIDKSILHQYERLCLGRGGQGIALVDKENCGACGMLLRPQLINQIQKAHELVFCDNCSMILFKK
jgi:predicted  nucleic acid-binding Zn-ribbon protein